MAELDGFQKPRRGSGILERRAAPANIGAAHFRSVKAAANTARVHRHHRTEGRYNPPVAHQNSSVGGSKSTVGRHNASVASDKQPVSRLNSAATHDKSTVSRGKSPESRDNPPVSHHKPPGTRNKRPVTPIQLTGKPTQNISHQVFTTNRPSEASNFGYRRYSTSANVYRTVQLTAQAGNSSLHARAGSPGADASFPTQ